MKIEAMWEFFLHICYKDVENISFKFYGISSEILGTSLNFENLFLFILFNSKVALLENAINVYLSL